MGITRWPTHVMMLITIKQKVFHPLILSSVSKDQHPEKRESLAAKTQLLMRLSNDAIIR